MAISPFGASGLDTGPPDLKAMLLEKLRRAREGIIEAGDKVPLQSVPGLIGTGAGLVDSARRAMRDPLDELSGEHQPATLGDVAGAVLSQPAAEVGAAVASPLADVALTGRDLKEAFGRATKGEATGWDYATGALAPLSVLPFVPHPGAIRGMMEGTKPARHIAKADEMGFYSPLERALAEHKTKQATPEEWIGLIQRTPGVKKEELEYTGIEDWLRGHGATEKSGQLPLLPQARLTREELAGFVEKAPRPQLTKREVADIKPTKFVVSDENGNEFGNYDTEEEAYQRVNEETQEAMQRVESENVPSEDDIADEEYGRYEIEEIADGEGKPAWIVTQDGERIHGGDTHFNTEHEAERWGRNAAREYAIDVYPDVAREFWDSRRGERLLEEINSGYFVGSAGGTDNFTDEQVEALRERVDDPTYQGSTWEEYTLHRASDESNPSDPTYRARIVKADPTMLPRARARAARLLPDESIEPGERSDFEREQPELFGVLDPERSTQTGYAPEHPQFPSRFQQVHAQWRGYGRGDERPKMPPEEFPGMPVDFEEAHPLADFPANLTHFERGEEGKNALFHNRMSDVDEVDWVPTGRTEGQVNAPKRGGKSLFLHETQSDWSLARRVMTAREPSKLNERMQNLRRRVMGDAPEMPLAKNWDRLAFNDALLNAAEGDYSSLSWPADAKQVKAIEHWSEVAAENQPIVDRMTKDFPEHARKIGKKYGVEPILKDVKFPDGEMHEVWTMPITDAMRKDLLSEQGGLPLYNLRGGGSRDLASMTADALRAQAKGAAVSAARGEVREQSEESKRRSERLRRPAEEIRP